MLWAIVTFALGIYWNSELTFLYKAASPCSDMWVSAPLHSNYNYSIVYCNDLADFVYQTLTKERSSVSTLLVMSPDSFLYTDKIYHNTINGGNEEKLDGEIQ